MQPQNACIFKFFRVYWFYRKVVGHMSEKMKELEISTKGREIIVEPKIVLEIAFSEIVESPEYETGYSIRFPVVKNIRKDKGPGDVDTVERLLSMYDAQ